MAISGRQGTIFVSGLVLGAAAAVCLVLGLRSAPGPQQAPVTQAPVKSEAPARRPAAAVQAAAVAAPHVACPAQPAARVSAAGDGRVRLQAEVSARTQADAAAFILAGKEAAASGRPRDAEVDFLMACRIADKLQGPDRLPAADARYQLGRHYANLALAGPAAANRGELLRRAEVLYADSARTYVANHGEAHEKSRFAAEGLARVRQTLAQDAKQGAPALARAQAQPQAAPQRQVTPAVAAPAVRQATGESSGPAPSFDCAKARSPSELAICSDPQLAQLDRDLGRLHARAKESAADPADFRRRNDAEWRRRETGCRGDRECLLRWYAERRAQLVDEIGAAAAERQPTAPR